MTKPKPPEQKKKAGRPSVYRPEYARQAAKLCERFAAVDADLADFFEVSQFLSFSAPSAAQSQLEVNQILWMWGSWMMNR
jgi:hypothetical protein